MDIRKGVVISRTNLIDSKKEAGLPWKGIGLVIFVTLFLWAGAFFYKDYVQKQTSALQNQLESLKSGRDYNKIAAVADSQSRLDAIDQALEDRVDWNLLFKKLEENTIPEVTFNNFDVKNSDEINSAIFASSASQNPEYEVSLKGTTQGLNNLAKQIAVFEGNKNDKTEPLFTKVTIQKIDIKKTDSNQTESGHALDFNLEATINPAILDTGFENKPKVTNQ